MKKAPATIEEKTVLLPNVIATPIAEMFVLNKWVKKLGNGNVTAEHDKPIQKEIGEWVSYLSLRAETHFQNNPDFREMIMEKGNKGRDHLYNFMHHWSGVTSIGVNHAKAEQGKKRFCESLKQNSSVSAE